jgi:hypothetical protein
MSTPHDLPAELLCAAVNSACMVETDRWAEMDLLRARKPERYLRVVLIMTGVAVSSAAPAASTIATLLRRSFVFTGDRVRRMLLRLRSRPVPGESLRAGRCP